MLLLRCRFLHHPFRRDLAVPELDLDRVGVEIPEVNVLVSMLLDPLRSIAYSRTFQVRSCGAT